MKILLLCSHRYYAPYTEHVAPFIYEQMQELKPLGCEFKICFVRGGGVKSYIKAYLDMKKMIKTYQPNIIHAHYGLCGFIAILQNRIPVVTTYHGSDVNNPHVRLCSKIAMAKSKCNIFVSNRLQQVAGKVSCSVVIPCGVDTNWFVPMDKTECRKNLGWNQDKTYILFSKEFLDYAKNYPLAKTVMEIFDPSATLVEFYGYTRQQAVWLYSAVDCALMTSFTEGSPQFIKEAVACGCPIVSTDVGDVNFVVRDVENCKITSYDAQEIAESMHQMIAIGHFKETQLDNKYDKRQVAKAILDQYIKVLTNR